MATRLIAARTLIDVDRDAEAKQLLGTIERDGLPAEHQATMLYLDGYFAQESGDHKRAIELYDKALLLDGKRVEAAINASSLLLEDGSPAALERAAGLIDRVPATHRGSSHLLYNQASLHARAGRTAEAKAALEQILESKAADSPHVARARLALDELARVGPS